MPALFDHEKVRAYQEALRFVAWSEPVLETLSGKTAARDQLDRAASNVVLDIAEGNGKRSAADRCRFQDIARGSGLECDACLDVLVAKQKLGLDYSVEGKEILIGVVSMIAELIARFSPATHEDPSSYKTLSDDFRENEND